MSIATTSLKYGWKVLALLTIGTGSIFVADNVLNRITTKDRIEVTMAVIERCIATQTGTNPATYGVDPPSIVRTWTDTNGASVIVTNALAWRDDLSMKVALDAKIFDLIPYYVDTDTVYDGTTNIVMLTVTGLWASLGIGDGTNQFTATPCWTNNVGETNCTTNAATYGPWAWRNYIVAWQERYKVLEALKMTFVTPTKSGTNWAGYSEYDHVWTVAKTDAENGWGSSGGQPVGKGAAGIKDSGWYVATIFGGVWQYWAIASTSILHKVYFYASAKTWDHTGYWGVTVTNAVNKTFEGYGVVASTNGWQLINDSGWVNDLKSYSESIGDTNIPAWCDEPNSGPFERYYWNPGYEDPYIYVYARSKGYLITSMSSPILWQFNYCTDKYW